MCIWSYLHVNLHTKILNIIIVNIIIITIIIIFIIINLFLDVQVNTYPQRRTVVTHCPLGVFGLFQEFEKILALMDSLLWAF